MGQKVGRILAVMGKWINSKPNWLGDLNNTERPSAASEKPFGRPVNDAKDYGVRYTPLKCPKCKSKDVKCYSSHPPVRYHVCNKCRHNFKSLEVDSGF